LVVVCLALILGSFGCESSTSPPDARDEVPIRTFNVLALEVPSGSTARASDLHASGRAVGYVREEAGGRKVGALWDGASLVGLWELDGWDVAARAVNGTGRVAATVTSGTVPRCGYGAILEDGGITPFTPIPTDEEIEEESCPNIAIHDMDEAGRVLGWLGSRYSSSLYHEGAITDLAGEGPPDTGSPTGWGISETGLIVGSVSMGSFPRPAHWSLEDLEEGTDLPSNRIPGPDGIGSWGRAAAASSVNGVGVAVIHGGATGSGRPMLYDFRSDEGRSAIDTASVGARLHDPEGATLHALNDAEEGVGTLEGLGPFYLSPSGQVFSIGAIWLVEEAVTIDDRGWILAHAREGSGSELRPVLLVPTS